MSEKLESLESLARLAKETSAEKRRELLHEVSNLFLEKPEEISSRESDYFADIMGKIAFDLEMEVRRDMAERLAKVDAAPHKLMKMLANDKIEVARPVLMESGVLNNADLIEIIKRHSQEHLMAVSVRKSISEDVTDHLVERGDDSVLETLTRNEGAAFTQKSLEIMVNRAEDNETLHEPLIKREDIPAYMKHQMFLFVSSALRKHILENVEDIDESEVDKLIEESCAALDYQGGEEALSPAERFIIRKENFKQLNHDLLVQLLRQGKIAEFIAGLGRLANIDTAAAHRITFDKGGEPLAVACKAIGIDRITFSDLLLLTNQEGLRDQAERDDLIGVYTRITTEAAQRTIRFWRTRKQMMKNLEKK